MSPKLGPCPSRNTGRIGPLSATYGVGWSIMAPNLLERYERGRSERGTVEDEKTEKM